MRKVFLMVYLWMIWIPALAAPEPADTVVWKFDRLDNIGGYKTTVLGKPKVIDSPLGKAVEFDGVGDALFIDNYPLAGAKTFTFEAIFRPDPAQTTQPPFSSIHPHPTPSPPSNNQIPS